jgi:hypothetical protein
MVEDEGSVTLLEMVVVVFVKGSEVDVVDALCSQSKL